MSTSGNVINLTFTPNSQCDPAISAASTCCAADLQKVELVIQDQCRNAIATVTAPPEEPSRPQMPSYGIQTFPAGLAPPGYPTSLLVGKVTGLNSSGQTKRVSITLNANGPCPTPATFLYGGRLWFAVYGNSPAIPTQYSCCGTRTI